MVRANIKRWLVIIALLALHLALLMHYGVQPDDLTKFLLTVLAVTIIPGWLLLSCLHLYEDDSYRFVVAPIMGICLDIIFYIVFSILGWPGIYAVTALALLLLIGQRKSLASDMGRLAALPGNLGPADFIGLGCLSLLLAVLLVLFQYVPNPLPEGSHPLIYYIDQTWHLGNIAEIKNHWFPQDSRLAGYPFHYHTFVYIFIAFVARISGLTIPVLYLRLGTWFLLVLLFFTVYYTGCRWFHNRRAGLLHLVTFFFLGTLLLSYPFNLFLINLFTSPTFLLAAIFTLALLLQIKTYMEQGGPNSLVIIVLLVIGLTGAKGNFFPLIFCGLLVYWFYTRLSSSPDRRINTLLMAASIPFLVVFLYIFKGAGSQGLTVAPFEVAEYTHLYTVFSQWLGPYSGGWLKWAVAPIYLIALLSFRLPVLIKLGRELVDSLPRPGFVPIFMSAIITAAFTSGFLLSYRGRSEYFFLFVGLICLNLMAAGKLWELFAPGRSRLLKIVLIVFILGSAVDTGLTARHLPQVIPELAVSSYQPLTPSLYEALTFVRDNTEPDALVAGHRAFIYTPDDPRFFYYSAFAERRLLVEGWGYMSSPRQAVARTRFEDMGLLYSTWDEELARRILDKYSIDYLIVENRINQHLWFNSGRYLQLRFTNGDVEIYQTIK